jgi:hypothetical protein
VPVGVPVGVPVPVVLPPLPLLPDIPVPEPDVDPVLEPDPELPELLLEGLADAPLNGERTDPDPPHAASETTAVAMRPERRVRLRTLLEDMLCMIITPHNAMRSTCSGSLR